MKVNKSLVVAAAIATVGLAGLGSATLVSAETSSDTSAKSSIVDKLVEKFSLNKAEVEAVFEAERAEHHAAREAEQKERLADAVKDGDLTQSQADHIQKVTDEIKALRGDAAPGELSDEVGDQIRDKLDELRDWAEENDIDMRNVGVGGGRGFGGGHGGGPHGS